MSKRYETGGASLFVVIFVTVIITIVTVSFTALMIKNQQQTSSNDLSQRAYDSAMAGVEDAKRVLVAMQTACSGADPVRCTSLKNIISNSASTQNCKTLYDAGITTQVKKDGSGTYLETQVGAAADNQAYTCVTIDMVTPDYKDSLSADTPTVVPLKGESQFDSVKLTWFTRDDAVAGGQGQTDSTVYIYNNTADKMPLPKQGTGSGGWDASTTRPTPALMRAQYIPGSGTASSLTGSAKTLFLYPKSNTVGQASASFNLDTHDSSMGSFLPIGAKCLNYNSINGACSITLNLPAATLSGYLQLTSLYHDTHFTVQLLNGATPVNFDGVQPLVDSTGRASDLFRRVAARVKVSNASLPYPEGAVDVSGNLCKAFSLSDTNGNTYSPGNCTP